MGAVPTDPHERSEETAAGISLGAVRAGTTDARQGSPGASLRVKTGSLVIPATALRGVRILVVGIEQLGAFEVPHDWRAQGVTWRAQNQHTRSRLPARDS